MNILVSTTVGYNLGDEIILIGVKSLLRTLFPSANYFIYNRNPDLWHNQHLHGNYLNKVEDFIDLVVLAGTPEFYLEKMHPLYGTVGDRPIWAIGIGWGVEHLLPGDVLKTALKKDNFRVIARSEVTRDIIDKPIYVLPCPALLADVVKNYNPELGVCFVGDADHNPDHYQVLCYSLDEFKKAPQSKYFTDAREFLADLAQYKTVVTTRLHAALGAMAGGCNDVQLVKEDFRIKTAMQTVNDYLEIDTLHDLRTEYLFILQNWKTLDKL
jgi:hypothetical protein